MTLRGPLLSAPFLALMLIQGAAYSDEASDRMMVLADGKLSVQTPADWKKVKPRSRIIEYEYSASAAEGDKQNARVTVMGAGGSIDANIARWQGQFMQPDLASTKERTKIEKHEIAGCDVRLIDIKGTFKDKPGGPFSRQPTVMRKDYRMLSAIIVTPKYGQYFVKMYGPEKTVTANEKAFKAMLDTVKLK